MVKTHYDNLQVTRNASPEVIRGAYKHLIQKWHPDKNLDNKIEAERVLKVINRAYEVLSDPELRKEHDDWIAQQERDELASASKYSNPQNAADPDITAEVNPKEEFAIWNPNATVNWSLLFTPIFGAWLQAKNWNSLGEKSKADKSMGWVYAGGVVLILVFFLPEQGARSLSFMYLIIWYIFSGRLQAKFVKEKFGGTYIKRGWIKPLALASTFLVAFSVLVFFSPSVQKEMAIEEINGIWKFSDNKTMITFQLSERDSIVKIDDEIIPVTVNKFDSDNKVLTLFIDNNPSTVWSIRQIYDENNQFTLQMTLEDGTQADLSFVR